MREVLEETGLDVSICENDLHIHFVPDWLLCNVL